MKRYIPVHLVALLVWPAILTAQVPHLLNYQGRVAVGSVNFEGTGQFKFALVNANGSTTYWSNDNTSTAGSQPTAAVPLTVTKGLYAVLLGDTALPNMTAIPASVWTHPDVRLRVWFNDGTNGSQLLTPDQRLAPNGYLPDGSVTEAKLADGSISGAKLAGGSIGGAQLAPGLTLGGITSGTFSGNLAGNATTATTANTATTAVSFSGPLAGEVTGTQGATTIAAAAITSKLLTGFSSTTGAITASDSILTAINKLDGNLGLKAPLASPTFTGTVSGTFSGNGSALTSLNATNLGSGTLADARLSANVALRNAVNNFSATQTLAAGTATVAPLKLQEGTNLTTPQFGAVEFDGTNLFLTNDSGSPTRKTIAFTDSTISAGQIANGTITGAMLANGAVGSAQLAAGAVTATAIAPGTVLPAQTVSGNTEALANTSYAATGSVTPNTFPLPTAANVGDVIQITGNGSVGWNTTGAWVARESNRQWRAVASSDDGS